MRENKGRRIVLLVLFLLIAGNLLMHIRISGADAKSRLASEVYSARELITQIRSGEADGDWPEASVEAFAAVTEAAAEIQSDLNATEEQAEEALEKLKEARKNLEAAEGTTEVTVETESESELSPDGAESADEASATEKETEREKQETAKAHRQTDSGSAEKNIPAMADTQLEAEKNAPTNVDGERTSDALTDIGDTSRGSSVLEKGRETKEKQKETEKKKIKVDGELDLTGKGGSAVPETEKRQETENAPTAEAPKKETEAPSQDKSDTVPQKTCTITIRCETILRNMGDLREGLAGYVPSNGIILKKTTVELYDGETVFEVLKRVTRMAGLKLEFRNDSVHGAGYIVGINHLNEFDCGAGSGWMYTVNGWFPNYGCSKYVLQNKDVIQWIYTCDLGRDIGGNFWE